MSRLVPVWRQLQSLNINVIQNINDIFIQVDSFFGDIREPMSNFKCNFALVRRGAVASRSMSSAQSATNQL